MFCPTGASVIMTDAYGPSWMSAGKIFVPSHLKPGNTQSSFAHSEPHRRRRLSDTQDGTKRSTQPVFGGTFASARPRPTNNPQQGAPDIESDLPPTESITLNRLMRRNEDCDPDNPLVFDPLDRLDQTQPRKKTPHGYSVIIFGFPANLTSAVIQHFSLFGKIIDDPMQEEARWFSDSAENEDPRPPPVKCGRNWLRITYSDESSAKRALKENGTVFTGQYVIGCISGDSPTSWGNVDGLLADDKIRSQIERSDVLLVKTPKKSLFQAPKKEPVKHPDLLPQKEPQGWLAWLYYKAWNFIFGWDNL